MCKKILLISFLLPNLAFAAFSLPWLATSTTQGWTFPSKVNGTEQIVVGTSYIATSTTATSTFSGLMDIFGNLVTGNRISASNYLATSTTATSTFSGLVDIFSNLVVGNRISASYFTATSSLINTFPYASTTAITVSGTASTTNLIISNLLTVGGTATSTFSGNIQAKNIEATNALIGDITFSDAGNATIGGTLTASNFNATSTTATSAFSGNLTVTGTTGLTGKLTAVYASTTGESTAYSSSTLGTIGTLTLNTPLTVPNGGTGAITLTGCLTGNGTGAITGSGTCNTTNATVSSVGSGTGLTGGTITTTGTLSFASIAANSLWVNQTGASAVPTVTATSSLFTWNGTGLVVRDTSPSFTTPDLGTPSAGVVTNLTGTASININGTVGATTPTTGSFTTIAASGGYTQSGTNADTFTGTPTFSNATYSALFTGGKVGIGVTAPGRALSVVGITGFNSSGTTEKGYMSAESTGVDFSLGNIRLDSRSTNNSWFNTGGNVGIGTTAPGAVLDVNGTFIARDISIITSSLKVGSVGGYTQSGGHINDLAIVGDSSAATTAAALQFGDNNQGGSRQFAIVNGYTGTAQTLATLNFLGATAVNTDPVSASRNVIMSMQAGGNVGIGTTSPAYKFTVDNAGTAGGVAGFENSSGECVINPTASSVNCASDSRLKKNLNQLSATSALQGILALNPVYFNWNNEADGTAQHSGFIAQSVAEVFLDLVTQSSTSGYYLLNYAGLTSYLVSALQDMNKVIDLKNATTSTPAMVIDSQGNIGIGTSTPEYKMQVLGDVAATSFVNISTRTAKKDIQYVSDDDKRSISDKIRNIKVAEYRYNGESGAAPLRLGLIAEEAPPEVLSATGKGVDVYKLSTFILAGLQEQQKRVEGLEIRITALETRIGSSTSPTISSSLADVAAAVKQLIQSGGEWVVSKITAAVGTFGTAKVENGLEMKDSSTGQTYCITIKNGEWDKRLGQCNTQSPISNNQTNATSTQNTNGDTTAPILTVNGNNPANIDIHSAYVDLGASVTDNVDHNLGVKASLDNSTWIDVSEIHLDTASSTTYTIYYKATDNAGNVGRAERIVNIGGGTTSAVESAAGATSTSAQGSSTPAVAEPSSIPATSASGSETASSTPNNVGTGAAETASTTPAA